MAKRQREVLVRLLPLLLPLGLRLVAVEEAPVEVRWIRRLSVGCEVVVVVFVEVTLNIALRM